MHYLNEYYKSHTYESVTLKEKALKYENPVKKTGVSFETPVKRAPHLRAEFLERIVCAIRGFTVPPIGIPIVPKSIGKW